MIVWSGAVFILRWSCFLLSWAIRYNLGEREYRSQSIRRERVNMIMRSHCAPQPSPPNNIMCMEVVYSATRFKWSRWALASCCKENRLYMTICLQMIRIICMGKPLAINDQQIVFANYSDYPDGPACCKKDESSFLNLTWFWPLVFLLFPWGQQ